MLSKFSILKNGINEKFIPRLSDHCKAEIEGSFKITKNDELRSSCKIGDDSIIVHLSDKDEKLLSIFDNNGAEIQ
jgi:hypothetical protein